MGDGLYVSMCGAAARIAQLDAVADNLANAQTPGFKAARPAFAAFLAASRAEDKAWPAATATGFDLSPGPTTPTGKPLDVVPEGDAFLAVALPDGRVGYTRDGRLSVDAEGRLQAAGRPVLDVEGRPILVPPGTAPAVEADGTVRAGGVPVGTLGLHRLEGNVDRVGPALLAPSGGGDAVPVEAGRVRTGEIELGNSGALEATVELISAQRHFDSSMQALQTYRRMDERSTEVGRVR
jgi:flagellar basal-body rod protein FlgF